MVEYNGDAANTQSIWKEDVCVVLAYDRKTLGGDANALGGVVGKLTEHLWSATGELEELGSLGYAWLGFGEGFGERGWGGPGGGSKQWGEPSLRPGLAGVGSAVQLFEVQGKPEQYRAKRNVWCS